MKSGEVAVYGMLWLVSLVFLLVKGSLLNRVGLKSFDIDIVIVVIAYLLTCNKSVGAGVFALFQGILLDIFSAGLFGLFSLLYLVLFGSIHLGTRLFDPRYPKGLVILVSLAVSLKMVVFVSFLEAFSLEMVAYPSNFFTIAVSALCTGLIAPFFFFVINQIKKSLVKDVHEAI